MEKITAHTRDQVDIYPTVKSYIDAHGLEFFKDNYCIDQILVVEIAVGNFPVYSVHPFVEEYEVQDLLLEEYEEDLEAGTLNYNYYTIEDFLETFDEYEPK